MARRHARLAVASSSRDSGDRSYPLWVLLATTGMRRGEALGLRWCDVDLEDGVHPRVVQERLGHSTIAITLGIYSHVSPRLHDEAANLISLALYLLRSARTQPTAPTR